MVLAALGLLSALLAALVMLPWARNRWQYRHIPGPLSPPLVGDLVHIVRKGMHEYLWQCRQKYGKIFKVYLGSSMILVVADADIARRVNYRSINRNLGRQLRLEEQDDMLAVQGLVGARDETWRTLRLAWQPAFQSGSLEGYAGLMDSCAAALAARLAEVGADGAVVDIWRELGRMTLQVVGTTAYGVDFHTLPEGDTPSEEVQAGVALMKACQTVFAQGSITQGSPYLLLNAMLPRSGFVSWLARKAPDARLLQFLEARRTIREVSRRLVASWRAAHPAPAANGAAAAANGKHEPNGAAAAAVAAKGVAEEPLIESISPTITPSSSTGADTKQAADQAAAANGGAHANGKAAPPLRRPAGRGISPGSFMGLMLTAQDKGSGAALTDVQVLAQSNTFILAGYETTANTLAFCVAAIAAHPRVQARLLDEIDAYGRDRQVAYGDLGQFPYTEAVIREALRLFPPATLLNREVSEGGFQVTPEIFAPAKSSIFSFAYGYQRDPEYWPAAEDFRPERWLPEGAALAPAKPDVVWTPFGAGARMCVGWRFALQEAKIALVRLYQHQTYALEPGMSPLPLQQNLTLSPRDGVRVRVVPRA